MTDNCPICDRPFELGPIYKIVPSHGLVILDGTKIRMRRNDLTLFTLLAQNAPRVVSHDALFESAPRKRGAGLEILKVQISNIRSALRGSPLEGHVRTHWSEGYSLDIQRRPEIVEVGIYDGEDQAETQ